MKIYLIDDLTSGASNTHLIAGRWFTAKPENVRYNLKSRIKAALQVLTGKATPVYFAEDIEEEIIATQKSHRERVEKELMR